MLAILGLLGAGVALSAFVMTTGDDSDEEEFTEGEDAVVDEAFRADVQANFLDLVSAGELTQSEADAGLAAINFTSGPQNIDTGDGDDVVLLSAGENMISTGTGEDAVFSGSGNDTIDLGADDDVYGFEDRQFTRGDDLISFPTIEEGAALSAHATEAVLEGGDDQIIGGTGNDLIADNFGSNTIFGNQGADIISTVDDPTDQGTPDVVQGGYGYDTLLVDEGDRVETGRGLDTVIVDVFAGVDDGYDLVTITDFMRGLDVLELEGTAEMLRTPTPEDPDDVAVNPVSVAPIEDGSGSMVYINGIPVVRVIGSLDLSVDDIRLNT